MRVWIVTGLALLTLGGCKDSGGTGNNKNGDMTDSSGGGNFTVLTTQTDLAVGSPECALGGVMFNVGLDNGDGGGTARNGALEAGEVDKSTPVCFTSTGVFPTITDSTTLNPGDTHCPFGGQAIRYGVDDGRAGGTASNGKLETGEVQGTTYACVPTPDNLLVRTTPLFGDILAEMSEEELAISKSTPSAQFPPA